jgi:ADP-heptose:LPS heptosyltransferase
VRRLLIRPGAIGDIIVSLPALEALRADYTEVWVPGATAPLIRFADRVRALAATGIDLLELGLAPPQLRDELAGFDSIISWYGSSRPEFRNAAAGLPFKFFPALPDAAAGCHAADFYLAQAGAAPGGVPRIPFPGAPRERFAVIHPFSGSAKKNWPLENFRAVAAFLESKGTPVCWCAGPGEQFDGAIRFEDLYELGCWLARASVYIGNDSGITHLAAAAGTPVVSLFGPTNPRVWAPRGESVRVVRAERLDAIPPARVIAFL